MAIYLFLLYSTFDLLGYLNQFRIFREVVQIGPTAGNALIAFALNRLGTPVRVVLTTYLMPYTAPRINFYANPLLRKIGVTFGYGPGVAEPGKPHEMDVDDFPGVEIISKTK